MDSLVTTEWLAGDMAASDLRIVDASYHLPDTGRDARAEYEAGHVPGAVFLDLGALVDSTSGLDNTLPSPEKFASRMQALGLGDGSRIVVYDDSAVKSAARAWFLLRLFGANNVAILDGGLARWKAEKRPLASGVESSRPRHYTAWKEAKWLRTKADVLANLTTRFEQVVDARSAARFAGTSPEPRPGVAPGHIPGAINVPYTTLYQTDGTFKPKAEIRSTFEGAGVALDCPIVTTCGSGITACVLNFGLHLLGKDDVALYDGSWAEWGSDPKTPKAVTEAA